MDTQPHTKGTRCPEPPSEGCPGAALGKGSRARSWGCTEQRERGSGEKWADGQRCWFSLQGKHRALGQPGKHPPGARPCGHTSRPIRDGSGLVLGARACRLRALVAHRAACPAVGNGSCSLRASPHKDAGAGCREGTPRACCLLPEGVLRAGHDQAALQLRGGTKAPPRVIWGPARGGGVGSMGGAQMPVAAWSSA